MNSIEEIIKELKDLKGMPTIEERAKAYSKTQAIECYAYCGYERGAIDQRYIDIKEFADRLTEMQGEYITLELIKDLVEELKGKDYKDMPLDNNIFYHNNLKDIIDKL